MTAADAESYGFVVEWFDQQAQLPREYQLTAFVQQRGPLEVAMYDPKVKRSFLKRMPVQNLSLQDFYVGSTVTLHARQLKVKAYLDARTQQALESRRDYFSALVQPRAFPQIGHVVAEMEAAGFQVCRLRLVNDHGPVVALQALGTGQDAGGKWDALSGKFPAGFLKQVDEGEAAPYFEDLRRYPCTAAFNNCTLCIIRPHALKAGNAGTIIASIMEAGFEVSAMQMLHLQRSQSLELHEVYKGVLPYQTEMVDTMCAAPCLALELRAPEGVVEKFRDLCGPHDVDMAKHLRPNTLRARFGLDNAQNAVHATDLEDDAETEVQYVFGTLLASN